MRFSAISSRVKSWVSNSTLDGSLEMTAGRTGVELAAEENADGVPQRNTLLKDFQNDSELGIGADLIEFARSLSTAALTRYAIADQI